VRCTREGRLVDSIAFEWDMARGWQSGGWARVQDGHERAAPNYARPAEARFGAGGEWRVRSRSRRTGCMACGWQGAGRRRGYSEGRTQARSPTRQRISLSREWELGRLHRTLRMLVRCYSCNHCAHNVGLVCDLWHCASVGGRSSPGGGSLSAVTSGRGVTLGSTAPDVAD